MVALLIVVSVILFAILIYLLRPSREDLQEMEVRFEDLAQLWLPYNEKIQQAPIDDTIVVDELYRSEATTGDEAQETVSTTSSQLPETVPPTLSNEFWKDCVNPYIDVIREQGVMDVINALIELLEKHGHYPSVVSDNNDTESIELLSVRDNLSNISLKEHSYQVARIMIDLVKNTYKEHQPLMPKAIITALAHDIGKIPEFRLSGLYNTAEHPLVSGGKLSELFTGIDVFWSRHVIQAVREHHHKSEDQWTNLLKQSDREARQIELIRFTRDFSIKDFSDWFDLDVFLKKLEAYVNVTQVNKWQAFSCKGIIYSKPQLLYDIAKEMAKEAKVLDMSLIYESEKESVFRRVVKALKNANLIPDYITENQYGKRFEIKTTIPSPKKQKFFLTPIKMDDRFNIAEIEKRKQGFTEIIRDVVLA